MAAFGFVASVVGAPPSTKGVATTADAEAAYTAMIGKRADDIVAALGLTDPAAVDRMRHVLVGRYRDLRTWHDAHDQELASLGWKADADAPPAAMAGRIEAVQADRRAGHDALLKTLATDLTPKQVETVKDKMTYDKVRVTYAAYLQIVPNLTDEEKTRLMALLVAAREEAVDGGSSEEKSAIFKRYKNRCKAYLISCGHDVNRDYANWGEAQKRRAASRPAGG